MSSNISLGIIGGLGPETTAKFYRKIIQYYNETEQQH